MKSASGELISFLLAAVFAGLVNLSSANGEERSWKDETALVSPLGNQTVVRPLEGDEILFRNTDPQLAIEWAMANAWTTVVLAGQYVINDAIDIPRDDVTLIIGQGAELSLNREPEIENTMTCLPPHTHLVAVIWNRCDNVRLIHFGTITRQSRAPGQPGKIGKPVRSTDVGGKHLYPIVFDGRNPRGRPVTSGMLLVAGAIPHQEPWLTSCRNIEVPLIAPNPCVEMTALAMEGCHDCKLGMIVNLDCKHEGCEGGPSDGKTGEAVDMNALDVGITMERVIGERCYEIIDCNASQATVGEIVSIGKSDKFVTLTEGCGARTISRGRMTPKLDIVRRTILEDATDATLQVEAPELPDALPRFTVKATVEIALKDGSTKEYTKKVEIDVRDSGPRLSSEKPFFEVWDEDIPIMGHLAVAMDGTVLLFKEQREKGVVEVKRSEDGGKTWDEPIEVGKRVKIEGDMSDDGRYKGDHVGWSELANVTVDENTGDIMVFAGSLKPASFLYRSRDHGKTWKTESIVIKPDRNGWLATTYCCDPGITLRFGTRKGRLLMPAQVFVGSVDGEGSRTYLNKGQNRKYFARRYSSALFSDDGGKTWIPGAPFPVLGTSEPSLAELRDGRIYYNARTHVRPGNKIIGWSHDGGETWKDGREDDELFDGPPDEYGCKAALVRLPDEEREVLIFSSPGRRDIRHDITVWASFDGGETWPVKRLVKEGPGNYTWLAAGRKGTTSEGMIYLVANKDWMARFNLAWIMEISKPEAK